MRPDGEPIADSRSRDPERCREVGLVAMSAKLASLRKRLAKLEQEQADRARREELENWVRALSIHFLRCGQ